MSPLLRSNFIQQAQWIGDDHDLQLQLLYPTSDGGLRAFTLDAGVHFALPSGVAIDDATAIPDDALHAHLRMFTLLSGYVPCTTEWVNALTADSPSYIKTAAGAAKIHTIVNTEANAMTVEIRKAATSTPTRSLTVYYDALTTYAYTPSTQLWVVAGSIKAEYDSYVHGLDNSAYLTPTQKDDIIAYVMGLSVWV